MSDLPAIGAPAARALASVAITTIEQAAEYGEARLLGLHGMGPKAVRILRESAQEKGIPFSG